MALTEAALQAELENDPNSYGYAALIDTSDHVGLAAMLNLVRDGTNGGPAIVIRKADVPGNEIFQQILLSDLVALPGSPTAAQLSSERRAMAWLTALPVVTAVRLLNDDDTDAPIVANLRSMLTAGSESLTRLAALATRHGSRAEQLGGVNTRVTHRDITRAVAS